MVLKQPQVGDVYYEEVEDVEEVKTLTRLGTFSKVYYMWNGTGWAVVQLGKDETVTFNA
jgi:hypothetical protein